MTDREWAVGAYAILLDTYIHAPTPEIKKATKDVLDLAPEIIRKAGREIYGRILEGL